MQVNLEARSYKALKATNREQAMRIVAKEKPDLIILDIVMPGIVGFAAC
jgi:DNA-binding response OmpR family regulator